MEAEGCSIVKSVKSFSGQTVHKLIASGTETIGRRGLLGDTENTDTEMFYYRVLHRDEVVECSVFKKL